MLFSLLKLEPHPKTPRLRPHGSRRKRLQKPSPTRQTKASIYSCKEATDLVRLHSYLTLLSGWNEEHPGVNMQPIQPTQPQKGKGLFRNSLGNKSNGSISVYGTGSIEEVEMKRWRDVKTPVFAIGQLEGDGSECPTEVTAEGLASIYQSLLSSSHLTPLSDSPRTGPKQKKIRKVKSQHSLRIPIDDQPLGPAWTEAETFMDLDSSRSPTLAHEGSNKEIGISNELCNNGVISNNGSKFLDSTCLENDIGLQICLDLLTCELAAAFFQQHPLEHQIRASKFQIQLLIEGYEVLLRQLQHMQLSEEDLGATEKIFHHWLEVLYYLYDLTQGPSPMNI